MTPVHSRGVANAWALVSRSSGDFLVDWAATSSAFSRLVRTTSGIRRLAGRLGDALPEGIFCSFWYGYVGSG